MQNKKDKAVDALNELKDEAKKINDGNSLKVWKTKATFILENIYGVNSTQVREVAKLKFWPGINNWDDIQSRRTEALELVNSLILVYEKLGSPKISSKAENGVTLHLTQNQTTSVKLNIVIESIQKELNADQFKDLQDLIYSNEVVGEEKKNRIIKKLKNFGSDLASNIIANILTNPNLYS